MAERILLKALDGRWETLGVDRDPTAKPEAIAPTWNQWGSDGLTVVVKRDPAVQQPDLQAFTPIRWEVDGRLLWAGFTIDTPGSDGLTIQALGWQHHLDDDVYSQMYVHSDLSEWKDAREFPLTYPNSWSAVPQVNAGDGQILCVWPQGGSILQLKRCGVMIDWGPDPASWPEAFDMTYTTLGGGWGTGDNQVVVSCYDMVSPTGGAGNDHDAYRSILGGTQKPGGTLLVDVDTSQVNPPRRYVAIYTWRTSADFAPLAADEGLKISALVFYRKAAYRLGGGASKSKLVVSDIIKDAAPRALLLDPATDEIATTALVLPHADWRGEDRTIREVVEQYNAYHRYRTKVDVAPKLSFQPQSARASMKVHAGLRGARFQDASVNSGRDLYNKVIVRGATGAGDPIKVIRRASDLPGVPFAPNAPQPINPSADSDAAGWTGGTITRDTSIFNSPPGSIHFESTGFAYTPVGAFPSGQVFRAGYTYILTLWARGPANGRYVVFGDLAGDDSSALVMGDIMSLDATFQQMTAAWVPKTDRPSDVVTVIIGKLDRMGGGPELWVDDVVVLGSAATLIDRRGFIRTKVLEVQSPTDAAACAALGDAYLQIANKVPLKGTLEISSDDAVMDLLTERPIPASDLGAKTGELVLLANLTDPDTGALGRAGKIAGVNYQDGKATVTIDNSRENFEALLARMGVVQRG